MEPSFFVNFGSRGSIPVFDMGAIRKKQRGAKVAAGREASQAAAAVWADGAASRPYSLSDLGNGGRNSAAYHYFNGLTQAQLKCECAMHGLPKTGAKYKLLESLVKYSTTSSFRTTANYSPGSGDGGATPQPTLKAQDAEKVRRALVSDLRKGLTWDKKFKRGANKMLKAAHGNCTPELFAKLFPHSAGKKKVAVGLEHLQVESLGRTLRYGGSLECVPGTLSANFDDAAGTISVTGKYTMM